METTTIQLSKKLKENIATFGSKNETYDAILKRMYTLAVKEQLRQLLMSEDDAVPISEAIKEAEQKWPE